MKFNFTSIDHMLTKGKIILLIAVVVGLTSMSACTGSGSNSPYEKMVQDELASGIRNDSLFLGLTLGMTNKDFYTKCWELNKEGLLIQGPNNRSVQYELLNDELNAEAYMHFYPNFYEDKILEMPINFSYKGWSPWIEELKTDSLLVDVKQLMEQWYGPGFIEVEDEEKGKAFVNVQGNRRISIYTKKENTVAVLITDLVARNEQLQATKP